MKVAIVHDDFMQWGGAERLVAYLTQMFPDAAVFTSMIDDTVIQKSGIDAARINTSWVDKLPFKKSFNRPLFFLYPFIFEAIDFNDYDLVISSSARFAHGVITQPQSKHIAYINSPFRGFWEPSAYFQGGLGRIAYTLLFRRLSQLRIWDYTAGQRPDAIIANSQTVKDRIKKYYHRDAEVIYPFVEFQRFHAEKSPSVDLPDDYCIILSRLVAWKKIDYVIDAFNQHAKNLVIIGTGEDEVRLRKLAGPSVVFTGFIPDDEATYIIKRAQALIHPQKEDFGMTVIEANYCGVPVIAFNAGGARETVMQGVTGELYNQQNKEALMGVVEEFKNERYRQDDLRAHAAKFSQASFQAKWHESIDKLLETN